MKKKKLSQGASTQGLKGSRKLTSGALSMYMGDGHRAGVEAIGEFNLCLPSGLVLMLYNCHYSPSITRGIISVSRLYKDGFVNRFENDNSISISKNNLIYFNAIPRDDIYEIVLSYTNDSSMYVVSNKTANLNLDYALLWHCRLGHINKKRIEKLQHDGLLDSTDIKSFEKCVACMSGKMIMSRQGASYFVTFTDDFSRYGYVYLLKHKHEVFETFKLFQKEVENQLGKTIKSLCSDRGDMVRSMMSQTTLPKSFWDYTLESVARILKMVPTKKVDKTPYEVWHGQAPKLSYLKVWGCKALVKRDTLTKPDKLEPKLLNLEIIQEEYTHPSLDTSLNHEEDDQEIDEPQSDINPIRRSTRTRHPTDQLCLYVDAEEHELADLGEPANYKAALLDPESDKWLNAKNVKMQSMKDNEVWELVDLPPNGKTIGHRWLFKKKTDMDGDVHTYKVHNRAIRILIAIVAFYDYENWQMDVKTAFLNGYLNEKVHMEQPEGFNNQKFPNRKFGFSQNRDELCVYVKASGSYVTFLILYVDDILIMGNNIPMLQDVNSYLGRCFAMKDLGEVAYILGIKIYRDRSKRLIGLCQSAYIEKIIKRFYMENSKRGTIPMQEKLKFSKSQGASTPTEIQRMQNIPYASTVGSIMYAVRCTRLDVAFSQNITSRFQRNPSDAHWTAVKNILKYLCNTKDMFLVYKDAEYIAAFDASKEAVWIRKFSSRLGVIPTIKEPINMYCDNTGAIAIAKDHGVTKGARHFRTKVHYLRETIEVGDVKIEKVDTDDNLAYPFTKALAFPKHSELTEKIGMIPASSLM
ncbi:retrotransposon protein, putative, ty1-copia subclass [Tanacetum coccineum]